MTHYYNDFVMRQLFEEAVERLEKMRGGDILTREELNKIIPAFDEHRPSCDENSEAYDLLIDFGFLIKKSKNKWIVAVPPKEVREGNLIKNLLLKEQRQKKKKIIQKGSFQMRKKKLYPASELARMQALLFDIGSKLSMAGNRNSLEPLRVFQGFQTEFNLLSQQISVKAELLEELLKNNKDDLDLARVEMVLDGICYANDFVTGAQGDDPKKYFSDSFIKEVIKISKKAWEYKNKIAPPLGESVKLQSECRKAVRKEVLDKFKKRR